MNGNQCCFFFCCVASSVCSVGLFIELIFLAIQVKETTQTESKATNEDELDPTVSNNRVQRTEQQFVKFIYCFCLTTAIPREPSQDD
jgi:hypothetical protein